ncbi:hypothetical protein QE152_g35276 [Popillia japonica]|uniref:Integrase zinc-binding domain-containing protein n=1 Tax=Popillia japonica TaxID=7064 RepID=A0AAW1IGJ8_POPJA
MFEVGSGMESIFWPNMCNEIRQVVANCPLCLKYSKSQPKEVLQSHEIPTLPWNKIRTVLPTTTDNLKPRITNRYNAEVIKQRQAKQQIYYNGRTIGEYSEILKDTNVFVQTRPKGEWYPGVVRSKVRNRDYKIEMNNGSILIRNRKFIKPVSETEFIKQYIFVKKRRCNIDVCVVSWHY